MSILTRTSVINRSAHRLFYVKQFPLSISQLKMYHQSKGGSGWAHYDQGLPPSLPRTPNQPWRGDVGPDEISLHNQQDPAAGFQVSRDQQNGYKPFDWSLVPRGPSVNDSNSLRKPNELLPSQTKGRPEKSYSTTNNAHLLNIHQRTSSQDFTTTRIAELTQKIIATGNVMSKKVRKRRKDFVIELEQLENVMRTRNKQNQFEG